jgi:hypothetical protein
MLLSTSKLPRIDNVDGFANALRIVCSHRHAGYLRVGVSERVVYFGFCGFLRARVGLRIPPGRVAIWCSGIDLVIGRATPLVAGANESVG